MGRREIELGGSVCRGGLTRFVWLAWWGLVAAWPARADGATVVSGQVGNQTWTAAGSPYQAQGAITVPVGQTLIIEAGTCVLVGDGGLAPNNPPPIDVLGTLMVNGTSAAPVTFDSVSGLARSWGGITVRGAAYIRGAIVHHGRSGVIVSGGVVNVRDSLFEDTGFAAIERTSGVASVDAIVARHNDSGVFSWGGTGTLTLTNSLIIDNKLDGVALDNSPPSTVTSCTIVGNQYGVYVFGSNGSVVRNSIIVNNRFGVQQQGSTPSVDITVVDSDVFGNNTNFDRAVPGRGCIAAAPLFVGPDDYHLAAGSPCIDTGATPDSNDHDLDGVSRPVGVALDMGAYEWTTAGGGRSGAGGAPICHGAGGEGGQAADAGDAAGADGAADSGAGGGAGNGFDAGSMGGAPGGGAGTPDGGGGSGGGGGGGATGSADAGAGGAAATGADASADARGPRVARHGCGCGLAPSDGGRWTVALFALGAAAAHRRRRRGRRDPK